MAQRGGARERRTSVKYVSAKKSKYIFNLLLDIFFIFATHIFCGQEYPTKNSRFFRLVSMEKNIQENI